MTHQFSYTKGPGADNIVTLAQKDLSATPIELSNNPGNDTITFVKNSSTRVRIVRADANRIFSWLGLEDCSGSPAENVATVKFLTSVTFTTQTGVNFLRTLPGGDVQKILSG